MEYKIYNASLQISKPPYEINNDDMKKDINLFQNEWNNKNETEWRYIGSVPSLEFARYMVEHNKVHYTKDGKIYSLECDPSDEFFCNFVKIEYGHNVEYYDDYNNHTDGKIFERRFI